MMGEELVEVKNKIIETSEEITPVVQFKEWVVDSDLPHIPFRQLVNKALQDVNLASVISKIEKGTEYVVKVPLEFKKAYDEGKVFVADKLCVSPKYLSSIVHQVSGKYATDWINQYVILEAKSMLRMESVAIKDVSNRLNFANQSFFAKFFKQHTGYTPKEYKAL